MRETYSGCLILLYATFIGQYTCANILDLSCINFNPIYDPDSTASFAAILNGADITSERFFQRSVELDSGARPSSWCSESEDDLTHCGLPQGSTIDSKGTVTLIETATDKFGVYGCQAERYNWTTESSTILIRDDAHFNPEYFTVTVSLDEDVRLVMIDTGTPGGSGSLLWKRNDKSGAQTDLTSDLTGNELYISKANKDAHAGIHHYYYDGQPDQGGLVRLIVRACLDNLWGPDCQYACPTCYNGGVCDDVTGRCICPPGFSGDHCGTACPAGMFGHDCSGSCSTLESGRTDCSGAVLCLPDPYGCSCAAGWTGLTCDQECSPGMYGAGCTQTCHCASSGSCDSATGACSNGCEDGSTGDQCQVTIVDMTSILNRAGVDETYDNSINLFMIGDSSVTGDASLKYYIGREVDTGPGETGKGATMGPNGIDMTSSWIDTGLPPETTFRYAPAGNSQHSLRSQITNNGGDARVGAYRMSINYRGWTERNILLNEYRGDSNSEVWPEKLSTTVGVGEIVTLTSLTTASVDATSLRWRHNGGSEITDWNGMTSVTIDDVRKSDDGIYECYVEGNRDTGKHAIIQLIVRSCPFKKYGFDCSQDCPVCYAEGVCHDVTGNCVCRAGFQGDDCEIPCGSNRWGRTCSVVCYSDNPGCPNRLFSPPNPVGMACITGYTGNRCLTACSSGKFGADCELDCNCAGTCSAEDGCPSGQCTSNYEGTYCQALRSDLPCPSGYFGTLCNYPCHCDGNVNCERTNGNCPNYCAEGWAGSDCQQALPRLMETPIVSDVTNDSVLLVWNAWRDGYDYGNGPVHSYQIDYSWTDDNGIKGSEEPVYIIGDSTALVTGLLGFRDYEFYVSVRREVEGQIVAGVKNGPLSAKTRCGARDPVDNVHFTSDKSNHLIITWSEPMHRCGALSYNVTRKLLLRDQCDASSADIVSWTEVDSTHIEYNDLLPHSTYEFGVLALHRGIEAGDTYRDTFESAELVPQEAPGNILVNNSENEMLIFTWVAPSCGMRNGDISYSYQLSGESIQDPITGTQEETTKSFEDLPFDADFEFTLCAATLIGNGPCDSVQAQTIPNSLCDVGGLSVAAAIVLGCAVVALGLYGAALTYLHMKLRKAYHKAQRKMNVYQDLKPSDRQQEPSTYEEIRTTPLNTTSSKDHSFNVMMTVGEEEVQSNRRRGGGVKESTPNHNDQHYENPKNDQEYENMNTST